MMGVSARAGTLICAPLPPPSRAEHRMGMPVSRESGWTVEELHALPNDLAHRYEIVDGELLVSPAPSWLHQRCTAELAMLLEAYAAQDTWGLVLVGPAEVVPSPRTAMQPDVFVVARPAQGLAMRWRPVDQLLFAAEVLSPTTARHDRVQKRPAYLGMGATYWVVDVDARVVEQWLPESVRPDVLDRTIAWQGPQAPEPLTIDLPEFFARVYRPFAAD